MPWPFAAALVLLAALSTGLLGSALWEVLRARPDRQRWIGVGVAIVLAVGSTAALSAKFLPSRDISVSNASIQPWGALRKARTLDEVTGPPNQYQVTVEWTLERADLDPSTVYVKISLACLVVPGGKTLGGVADGVKAKITDGSSDQYNKMHFWRVAVPVESVQQGSGYVTVGPLNVTRDCGFSEPVATQVYANTIVNWTDFSGKRDSTWAQSPTQVDIV